MTDRSEHEDTPSDLGSRYLDKMRAPRILTVEDEEALQRLWSADD